MTPSLLTPVRSTRRTLGWPGVAGGLALLAATALAAGLMPRAPAVQMIAPSGPVPASTTGTVPPVAVRLAHLLERAVHEGVTVVRTEQRPRGAGERGTRLHMPARGGYQELRRFAEAALGADPALALESLQLRRGTPGDTTLEAEFVWWLAGDPR